MATPSVLAETELLIGIDANDILEATEQPLRAIYLLPRAGNWIENTLENLETDGAIDGANRPYDQLFDHFHEFISGVDIGASKWFPKRIRPSDQLVWELRTPDLRVFGWFWRKGIYIVSAINTAKMCKDHSLYPGYREQCRIDYQDLDLDPPKAITGDIDNVL